MNNNTRRIVPVIAEIISAGVIGFLAAFIMGRMAAGLASQSSEGFMDIVSAVAGAALASLLAVSGAVALVGRYLFRQRGSYWLALLGAMVGGILVLSVTPLVINSATLLQAAFMVLPSVCSALAFTWSAQRSK
jgi:hypothetical protein